MKVFVIILISMFVIPAVEVYANQQDMNLAAEALTVTIERHMQYRVFTDRHGLGKKVQSTIILVPVNEEVLEAAVAYRTAIENLSPSVSTQMLEQSKKYFFQSDLFAMVLLIHNGGAFCNDDLSVFVDFSNNMILHSEVKSYNLSKYTRTFSQPLAPGWNRGFLYFKDFRPDGSISYSVQFPEYVLNAAPERQYQHTGARYSWVFTFEASDLQLLASIQAGTPISTIRESYGISTFSGIGLSMEDIFGILGFFAQIVAVIK